MPDKYHYYDVHYPDGTIRKHRLNYESTYLPAPDKVFYNHLPPSFNIALYLRITEMSEEEIWTEEIDHDSYINFVFKDRIRFGVARTFACFLMSENACFLMSEKYVAGVLVDF